MQALYLSYTVGGIVCPLLTRPFMTASIDNNTSSYQENTNYILQPNYNTTPHNQTAIRDFDLGNEEESLRIHYAFILIGSATFLTAVPYFVMSCSGIYDMRITIDSKNTDQKDRTKLSKCNMYSIILCVCAVNLLYVATEDCVGAFLVTFSLQQLHWSKTQSVILMALYWGASCLGGITGMFIVRRLGIARMTFAAYFLWIFSFLCAIVCAQFNFHALIWVVIPISGTCMVVIIPNVISWTEANVCNISGKISSLIMMSTGTGIATNPPFIGHLMEKYSIMCFLYVLLIESFLCMLCFACAYFILRWLSGGGIPQSETIEIQLEEQEEKRREIECPVSIDTTNNVDSPLLIASNKGNISL